MSLIEKPCTCHPDDATKPCQRKYAASECQAALTAIMGEGDGVQRIDREAAADHREKWEIGLAGQEQTAEMFARHRSTAAAAERARIVAALHQDGSYEVADMIERGEV